MRNNKTFKLSAIALVISSNVVLAQSKDTGFSISADALIAYDDNIYRVSDELATSDAFVSIAPKIEFVGGLGKHRFQASYTGDYAEFNEESDASFTDHEFEARLDLDHTLRFSSQFEAGYQRAHEEPGRINRIQLDITEYNRFKQSYFLAGVSYGQESSIGKITLNYRRVDRDQTNNELDFLDNESDQWLARFTYRVAPKTKVYVEGSKTDFDYTPGSTFELDNEYIRYRAGVSWEFTNKLTGDVNIGYQDRNYSQEFLNDISGLTYDGQLSWSINTYTSVSIIASRESVDSAVQNAGGSLRTSYSTRVKHDLTELLAIRADFSYANDELVFSSNRQDKRYSYGFGLDYDLSRLVNLSAAYTYEERDSTNELANYEANIIGLSVNVKFGDL